MDTIIVTPRAMTRGPHPALRRIEDAGFRILFPSPGEQPTPTQLAVHLDTAVGWIAGVERIDGELLGRARRLKVISRNGTGIDNIDLEAARVHGIEIRTTGAANARGVAELTFAHILAAARAIPSSVAVLKSGAWERRQGTELEGKTLGIVGCGRIGKIVARLALGFDMKVLAFDPVPDVGFRPDGPFGWSTLDELLRNSDFITVHCPPGPGGRAVIDSGAVAKIKPGASVINTAREGSVDWRSLRAALDSGSLAWYTIDAYDKEPPGSTDMIAHPRVIPTPHIGGYTMESVERVTNEAIDNLLEALGKGRP